MKDYKVDYAYRRFGEWFTGNRTMTTKLHNNEITKSIFKKELEQFESTRVIVLSVNGCCS